MVLERSPLGHTLKPAKARKMCAISRRVASFGTVSTYSDERASCGNSGAAGAVMYSSQNPCSWPHHPPLADTLAIVAIQRVDRAST